MLRIAPLSPRLGAEVLGVDLRRPLDDATFDVIRQALLRHMVVRLPDQRIDEAQHVAFSRRFGPLQVHVLDQYRHPRFAEIYVLSNVDAATGATIGRHPDKGTLAWHSDLSFQKRPALATILHGLETPSEGGETEFADLAAAYDALDPATQQRIGGLRAVHDLDHSRRRMGEPPMTDAQRTQSPPVTHPVVRTHPETGRKVLYISRHVSHIDGWPADESDALLDRLMTHATRADFVFRYRWAARDLLMWDNRCTMHRATGYDTSGQRRVIHRTVVIGDEPV